MSSSEEEYDISHHHDRYLRLLIDVLCNYHLTYENLDDALLAYDIQCDLVDLPVDIEFDEAIRLITSGTYGHSLQGVINIVHDAIIHYKLTNIGDWMNELRIDIDTIETRLNEISREDNIV